MAWVERMLPSDQDEQFESWRKEFQQERLLRIVREREIMKETAKRCKSYQTREQEANEAIERKRQAILAQRKAATVQATMRFQRNLPGFTVMDPDKFDRAIETITGRQLSNRSTPRRTSTHQQQRSKANITFRRSISLEELRPKQQISNPHRIDQRNQTILTRTNSVTQVPQYVNQVQYTSPLQEVQRRVLNDFAAQVQSTLNQQQCDETNTWEHESVDSLETSNPQQIISPPKINGPIVRPTHVVTIQSKKSQQPIGNHSAFEIMTIDDQQEMLRRSYHESFFVKNTPVTGDEQVTAWLGAGKTPIESNKNGHVMEKPSSLDGNDPETNGKRKSILKRSPSVDSNTINSNKNTKPIAARKASVPQTRTIGEKARVKDSLEVINTKFLKELDTQKKTVRFAQDTDNERCVSDTQLVKQPDIDNKQTPLRRVQSAAMFTLPNRPPIKQPMGNDDRASECSSTTSSKPPVYPLTPTGQTRQGYTNIGLRQRELRAKLHKTRYAQSLRQTNTSPPMCDSPSSRRTPTSSPHIPMHMAPSKTNGFHNERRNNDDDENDSLFSELRLSSIPSSNFSQNDARLPPQVPLTITTNQITESKFNGTKNSTFQTPTTLSIEERRVKESIDRLDQQYKEVQTRTRSNSGTRIQKNQKR